MRCDQFGHDEASCTAQEQSEQNRCECGNPFHNPNRCPFNNNRTERQERLAVETGLICTWCKSTGDGRHTFTDCDEHRKFKKDLLAIVRRLYTALPFCWHCSSTDHHEIACRGPHVGFDVKRWESKIDDVILEWKNYQPISFDTAYRSNELNVPMYGTEECLAPPIAGSYHWCIMCEEFGHDPYTKPGGCNEANFQNRVPRQQQLPLNVQQQLPLNVQNSRVSHLQYYPQPVPQQISQHFTNPSSFPGFGLSSFSATQNVNLPCLKCSKSLGPWIFPIPPIGQQMMCFSCGTMNYHPHGRMGRESETVELIRYLDNRDLERQPRKRSKPTLPSAIQDLYLKRPSLKLQWTLRRSDTLSSLSTAAIHDFVYHDMHSVRPDISPVLFNSGQYFSSYHPPGSPFYAWGNFQEYFPAITFEITTRMRHEANNKDNAINRAGWMGLEAYCWNCKCAILVFDKEMDVVMCGTSDMNTMGEGTGYAFYHRKDGSLDGGRCDCVTIVGQKAWPIWVDWRTGWEVEMGATG